MVLEQAQVVLLSDPLNAHSIQLEAQAKVYYLLHLRTEECFLRQESRLSDPLFSEFAQSAGHGHLPSPASLYCSICS
ncbi:hypothetical protein QJS10_CPB04g01234 [Acorus calamus]|uniref:Uncharacterized protein n=1 Tax=Acorus calamus TaxID=4465 RepID=A0AAV9EYX2_ACOCL|nr:hypothetical protein QJS10_CPB04g01234 [Acorus calamus]